MIFDLLVDLANTNCSCESDRGMGYPCFSCRANELLKMDYTEIEQLAKEKPRRKVK